MNGWKRLCLICSLPSLLFCTSARADVAASLVLVGKPSVGAVASDPSLAAYTTYDLKVTVTNNTSNNQPDRWLTAQVRFKLTGASTFYNQTPYGQSTSGDKAQPGFWSLIPALEYDTFACSRNFGDVVFVGTFDPSVAGNPTFNSTEVNATYSSPLGNTDYNTSGQSLVYTIARFTISDNGTGFIYGTVSGENGALVPISRGSTTFAPEPAAMSLLALAAGALLRRPKHVPPSAI